MKRPMTVANTPAISPTRMEVRMPYISSRNKSRPKLSEPSHRFASGSWKARAIISSGSLRLICG
ncbi:hypothetical protein VQ056_15545 [Paenibacillus sp. JTLBN-2024]